MASKFLLALSLTLLVSSALAERRPSLQLSEEQQCRIQRLTAAQPTQRIESEGGVTEIWDERQEQFQCAGVVAMRNTIRANGLSLPNYHPTPRLVFIERGQGFIGITFPGCAETYHAHTTQRTRERSEEEERRQGSGKDMHQKVHRIRRGDIVATRGPLAFYLAGGVPQRGQQEQARQKFQNIFRAFDANLMAEAFNVPQEIVQRMQTEEEERGLIVIARERMSFITPEEQQQEWGRQSAADNGMEESFCTMKIRTNIENRREADMYSRQAGKLNVVDRNKLPILKYMDLSAEKGNLYPNALLSPDWAMHGHTIVYVTKGDAKIEIVGHNGQALMNDRVNQGDMFVVPQYYTSSCRAGNNGFEWVAFKTTGWPMRNPVAGYTSVMRAMPLQVLTNIYQISPNQAQGLKMNRGSQSFLLSPGGRQY
ncbi:hypothetical protein DH2020_001348 [Rehmannia glutinosa]|uniref:Cupin type-1 domain-containing protein n=1 Tax=Rehmannia glutinosa TaxID=99300 RepID=A0ABR0XZE4_REHGL